MRIIQYKGSTRLDASLPGNRNRAGFQNVMLRQKLRLCHLTFIALCSLFWISWPLKIGPIHCPETSARNYHPLLRNISAEHISHLVIRECRPWFDSAWFSSEQSGLAQSSSALHIWI